jgi:hypothetical protein
MKSGWCLTPTGSESHDRCPREFRNGDGTPISCECECGHTAVALAGRETNQLHLWGHTS